MANLSAYEGYTSKEASKKANKESNIEKNRGSDLKSSKDINKEPPADNHRFKPCFYFAPVLETTEKSSADKPELEFSSHPSCAYLSDQQQLILNPQHQKRLSFNQHQLATLYFEHQFYYVHRNGLSIAVIRYDNWADDFSDGLSRTRQDGKIGFFNQKLEVVIPPQYDWASPFDQGQANVCMGCRLQPQGEHQAVIGGLWSTIDKQGKPLKPLQKQ